MRYLTPFGFTEGADIIENGCLDAGLVVLGLLYGAVGIAAGYVKYCRKDIM